MKRMRSFQSGKKIKKSFLIGFSVYFLPYIRKKYDAVFDFTLSRKFGFFFMLAGIKKRIGYNYKKRGLFLTKAIEFSGFEDKHVIEYYLSLLRELDISVTDKDMQLVPEGKGLVWASEYLKKISATEDNLIAVIPGGGASWGSQSKRKRWAPEKFSAVSDALMERDYNVMILGHNSETELCNKVASGMKEKPLLVRNDLSLEKYFAILAKCQVVLCNDGGPLHIAVSLGRKTVSIFGPVDPKVYGPYPVSDRYRIMVNEHLDCRPCYKKFRVPDCDFKNKCLEEIDPGRVLEACVELMKVK